MGLGLKPAIHVISVGIDRNGHPSPPFNVVSCKKDAQSIIDKIEKDSRDTGVAFGELNIYLHCDEEATLDQISESFEKILRDARPDDLLVVFLAGVSDSMDGFRLFTHPPDRLEWKDGKEAIESALSLKKLQSLTSQIECKRQLIILDLCTEEGMQEGLISELSGQDPEITQLTDRNRVIICTEGWATEDSEGGALTHTLTGIDTNLLYIFDPKRRKQVEFEILKKQQSLELIPTEYNWFYSRIFYERDYVNTATAIGNTRGKDHLANRVKKKTAEGPQDYALVIGINEYVAYDWWNLKNPIEDGTKVAEILKVEYGYETQFLQNATYDDLQKALIGYSKLQDKQNLILFFAGHGHFEDQLHKDGFFVLNDSELLKQDPGMRSYYQFVNLQKIVDNFNFKRILLVIDVCFGGTFGYNTRTSYDFTPEQKEQLKELEKTVEEKSSKVTYESVGKKEYLDRKLMFKSRNFIASGAGVVKEGEELHSPFARNLLDALKSKGNESVQKDDLLTFEELKAYCDKNINMPIHGNFGSHEGGDFILIPSKVKEEMLGS